jgi:iron complex outermembrane receptor protein
MKSIRQALLLLLLLALTASSSMAQISLSGRVVEKSTRAPIPGVHVLTDFQNVGGVTDSEGVFRLEVPSLPARLSFSSLGFATVIQTVTSAEGDVLIQMQETLLDMDPLLISATRELQPRTDLPVSISAISAGQLERVNPDVMYQVFNQIAGVHMVDLGNDQYKLSIRQPFTNKAYFLFMEDGIPLRPIGIFNPNGMLDANMAGVERIEVLRGPSSSIYGGNAVAGSINFISKDPSRRLPKEISLRRDSYGYLRADFSGSATKGVVGVSLAGFTARQRDSWYEHSDYDRVSFTARADVRLSKDTQIENTLSYSNLNTDTNGALDSLSYVARGFNSLHTFSYREMESFRVKSAIKHAWNGGGQSTLTLFARSNRNDQLPYWRVRGVRGNSSKATGEINAQEFWSLGALGLQEWSFKPLNASLQAGFSVDSSPSTYRANWISVDRDADGRYASYTSPDSLLTDYAADIFNAALFVQGEIIPLPKLRVSGSLRFDHIQYAYDNKLSAEAYSSAPDETTTFRHVSPRLGVTYDLGNGRGVYSNLSLGFAPPEVNELYHGVSVPSLSPATFQSVELGGWAALAAGKAFIDLSLYSMKGVDEIIPIVAPNGSFVNENAGLTRHYGVEYTLLLVPNQLVSVRMSGSQSVHEFIDFMDFGVDRSGNEMAFAPRFVANGEVAITPQAVAGLRLSAEWNHVGPYYMDNSASAKYEGYDLLNLRASYDLHPFSVWINVVNVMDTLYATNAAAYVWGSTYNVGQVRSATLGARYRFK